MAISSRNQPALWEFLRSLVACEPRELTGDDPPWHEPGNYYRIDEATYWRYLELLPPRWMHCDWFAFGQGTGPFSLFIQHRNDYSVRMLTDAETKKFCELSGTSLYL